MWCSPSYAQDMSSYGVKKGITMTGGINFNTVSYQTTNKQGGRREPFNWFMSGNLNINAFGYSMPFNFSLSNAGKNYSQPFNRIQFKPYWKWIRGYWGNTSMSFSPLTLNGHLFNGYGVELTRSKWQFAAMYGKLKEAVAYDPIAMNTSTVAFKRKGWGFKGGYNRNGEELSLIFFTAKDDANSLTFVPQEAQLTPKQNTVVSISVKKKLFKKFNIQAEYALSGITSDVTAATETKQTSTKSFLSFLLPQNGNTKFYDAVKAAIGYNGKWYGLQFNYERIAPEYATLGAYYFNNDMRNITLAPNVRLFKNKLTISGNAGVQTNNLDKAKNSSTRRFVGNATVAYSPGEKWNYSGTYSNFTTFTNVRPQQDPFFVNQLDTLNFYQVNSSISATVTHSFGSKEVKKNITLNSTYQKASDQQTGTGNGTKNSNFINGSLAYSQTFTKKGMSISSSANYNSSNAPGNKSVFYGPNMNISKALLQKKVQASFGASYNKNTTNGISSSAVWSSRMNFSYAPKGRKLTGNSKTVDRDSKTVDREAGRKLTGDSKTVDREASEGKTGVKKIVKVANPLKGKQSMSLMINYMNRLPVALLKQGFSELTVTFNWSYSF
jgi:hypothetical protein